jgi:hypothetical protein
MDNCGKLVSGGPCMRTPGHGGQCFPGHIVSTTPDPGIPTSQFLITTPGSVMDFAGTWGRQNGLWWRLAWGFARNRDTIRFALLAVIFLAQVWIDVVCIMLWR